MKVILYNNANGFSLMQRLLTNNFKSQKTKLTGAAKKAQLSHSERPILAREENRKSTRLQTTLYPTQKALRPLPLN